MRRLIVGFFAVIGFVTVLVVAGIMLVIGDLKRSVTPLPGNILLTADLTRGLPEGASDDPFLRLLLGGKPTLRDFLDAIEAAGDDPRVKGLLARVNNGVSEIILATNPNVEGEATAIYTACVSQPHARFRVARLQRGRERQKDD